jgi:hypothetical protein
VEGAEEGGAAVFEPVAEVVGAGCVGGAVGSSVGHAEFGHERLFKGEEVAEDIAPGRGAAQDAGEILARVAPLGGHGGHGDEGAEGARRAEEALGGPAIGGAQELVAPARARVARGGAWGRHSHSS